MNLHRYTWYLLQKVALGVLLLAAAPALADVTVVNNSQETLYVASGQVVRNRIVYGGWTTIANAHSAKIYAGQDERIMLCVVSIRAGGLHVWPIGNSFASPADMMVTQGNFRCEQVGGATNEWKFSDRKGGQVYRIDDNHPWPAELGAFLATFYIVRGDQDQKFVP